MLGLGTFLAAPLDVPWPVVVFVAVSSVLLIRPVLKDYVSRPMTAREHEWDMASHSCQLDFRSYGAAGLLLTLARLAGRGRPDEVGTFDVGAFDFWVTGGGSTSSRLRSWSWPTRSRILQALSNIG